MLDKNVRDGLVNLLDDPENIQAQLQGKLEWNNSFPASITVRYHLLSSQRTSVYVQTTTLRPDHQRSKPGFSQGWYLRRICSRMAGKG
jgi:hypothetical protein